MIMLFSRIRCKNSLSLTTLIFFVFLQCTGAGKLQIASVSVNEQIIDKGISYSITENLIKINSSAHTTTIMEFPLDRAFIQASKSESEVQYKMAAFQFKDKALVECMDQSIEKIEVSNKTLVIRGNLFGETCESTYILRIIPVNSEEINFQLELNDPSLNRVSLSMQSDEDERFFGLGEQFTHFDFKGKKPFLFTEEQGIGRGDQPITTGANLVAGAGGNEYTTYAPIPHYITSRNRSVFIENSGYSKFDFTKDDSVKILFWDSNLEGSLKGTAWVASSPLELIELYTKKTGRMPEMPEWAYGTILGLQGGTKKVTKVVDDAIALKNPITALWIQDWCGKRVTNFGDQLQWRWYADESLYPEFTKFVKTMNQKNVKVLGYINPFLADVDPKKPGGDRFTNPMLEEAKAKGYLVKDIEGKPYLIQTVGFPAYLIDITNPEAIKWTKNIIKKNMIDVGLSGWMADFGEWLPTDAVLHSGVSAKVYHNRYPVEWAKLNREAIKEAGKEGQIVFFTRAGFSYSNKYSTLFWLGDQMVSFQKNDGLPSAVLGMTTSGISGISLNHSDIGGYTTISNPLKNYHRSKELLQRWAEMSAFTPVFRTHEGNRPLKNWQVYEYENSDQVKSLSDQETGIHFAKMGRLHFALKTYIKQLTKESSKLGYPVVRHPYLHFPNDPVVQKLKYQFMLGEDLMVFPVVESGEDEVKGYLPEGKWKHTATGKIYDGKTWIEVEAGIGNPAAFIRMNGKSQAVLEKALIGLR
jgi:sulfoquinovosidase